MECNKDDAIRAKEIAEKKFMEKDMAGAKKFALKAQRLYPELEGIYQMLASLDVHVSAENKIHGVSDWYGILGVSPLADDEAVRKQFRKLALMLHPDKNKSAGADEAFKLVSEAWCVLSDKAKRGAYDQKRRARAFSRVSAVTDEASAAPRASSHYNFKPLKRASTTSKMHRTAPENTGNSQYSEKLTHGTFWTVCYGCSTQFEYPRIYVDCNLLCRICRVPFFAEEVSRPTFDGSSNSWKFSQQHIGRKDKATTEVTSDSAQTLTKMSNIRSNEDKEGET
ncbi:hypothetical protein SAY86_008454 [Trapa natans]|uniref:J domain-containing protein n=1 Tax=Trapa natans TaxID=22666 RepID=A0AAN7K9I1_TRANT|nr:hypothetical protein SAY86_008454 [Trapa natans]